MTLGDRIKKIRCDRGLTQQQLADKLGVQRAAVHKYEEFITTDIDEICYHLNEFTKAYFGEPFATLEITDYQIEFEIQEALKTLNIEGKKAVKHYIDDISLIPKYLAPDSSEASDHEEGEGVNKTDTPG